MSKDSFRGWKKVYDFTLKQTIGMKGFQIVTILAGFILFGAIILITIISAQQKKDDSFSNNVEQDIEYGIGSQFNEIEDVFVYDDTKIADIDYKEMLKQIDEKQFETITFHYENNSREEAAKKAAEQAKAVAVIITKEEQNFLLQAAIPQSNQIDKVQAQQLLNAMADCFKVNKLLQAGVTKEQAVQIKTDTYINNFQIEEENTATTLIRLFAPMLFGLLLYFLLLFYGQTVCKEVSVEKVSKLAEMLLISVHPYSLMIGKVLAITVSALLQFCIWILSAVFGLVAGNAIASSMYPGYSNSIFQVIQFLRDNIGETALSIPSVILAIVIFCVGFLFYNMLAALAGCLVVRPEETASTQALFQFPIIISWLVSYLAFLMGKEGLVQVCRYVPLTAPFCVPAELATGSIGILEGFISTVILILFSLLTVILAAKIYRGLILYQGEKIKLATIIGILKTK